MIQIHNHPLAGVHVYRSRPNGLPLLRNRHLVAAGLDEQPLVPNPIVIELIDMTDEAGYLRGELTAGNMAS